MDKMLIGDTIHVWDSFQGRFWKRIVQRDKEGRAYFNKSGEKILLDARSITKYKIRKAKPIVRRPKY